jgi:hypothetical protein
MGKHEREVVYEAERILNDMLNGIEPSAQQKRHPLFSCVQRLKEAITADFPNIERSCHVGNIYGTSLGNIELHLADGREVFLELKFLTGGVGTRANIGQDSLTQFWLLEDDEICSWSQFREKEHHEKWVKEALAEFDEYPRDCEGIVERASYLKDIVGHDGGSVENAADQVLANPSSPKKKVKAAKIIKNIVGKDRAEKLRYIQYLRTLRQNAENIKKFLFLVLSGAHTHKALKGLWSLSLEDILGKLRQGYRVYYVYKGSLTVTKEDLTSKLADLMDKSLFIAIKEDQTNVLVSFRDKDGTEQPVLRIVFHWKNVFQGIKTPCLNVFDEAYLKSATC